MNHKWILIAILITLNSASTEAHAQFGSLFRSKPSVNEISTQQLQKLLLAQDDKDSAAPDFILVDVRSSEESDVSMIPGAITKAQYEQNRNDYKDRTVIPYCTVGGRSGRYAEALAKDGVKVLNYKESILGWCRGELPLVTPAGASTRRVHTYSSRNKVPSIYQAVW